MDWLPLLWFGIIGFGVFMYAILDGFVLGIGILMPLGCDEDDRDVMMSSVAPVWDGNETWLVLCGAGLLAGFPRAYAIILSALYLPVLFMLVALVLRGVCFEFRFQAHRLRVFWGRVFTGASIVAAMAQGIMLGALIKGLKLEEGVFKGGIWSWVDGFTLFTGVGLVVGYAMLGATWLVLKAEGRLCSDARAWAVKLFWALVVIAVIISAWVPLLSEHFHERWYSWPNIGVLALVPVALGFVMLQLWRRLGDNDCRPIAPFGWTLGYFALGYIGLVVGFWPYLIPPHITYLDASAAPSSQAFAAWGAVIMLPFILAYTGYSYHVFRGKVTGSYHH